METPIGTIATFRAPGPLANIRRVKKAHLVVVTSDRHVLQAYETGEACDSLVWEQVGGGPIDGVTTQMIIDRLMTRLERVS